MLKFLKQATQRIDTWLTYHQPTPDEQQQLKIQALQRILVLVAILIALNALNLNNLGLYARISTVPFYILTLLAIFVAVRKGFNFAVCIHIFLAVTYIFLLIGVLLHTGVQSVLVVWFHFLPFVAYAFNGKKWYVIFWTALAILTIFIIGRLQMAEILPTNTLSWQNELRYSSRTQVSFALLAGLIIVIYYSQVQKYKQKVQHLTQKNWEQAKENLALKEKELASLLSYIAQKNELLEKISHDLDQTKQQVENLTQENKEIQLNTQTKNIQNIRAYIQENTDINSFWEQFTLQFNKLHPNFFKKLYDFHPTLTQNEQRLCAYILMQISNKEIAVLQNVQLASIEQAKIRLKKKLELKETEGTIYSYLLAL